jgi:PPM family protein phosphatase
VMRGVSGSVLGFSLQEVDLVGCVRDGATATEDATVELRAPGDADCTILGVDDLQPSAREQVRSGLPSGTLDDARTQVARLASGDLLPPCTPPASATTTPSATPEATPAPTAAPPAPDPAVPVDPAAPVTTTIEPTPAPTPTLVAGQTCRTGS